MNYARNPYTRLAPAPTECRDLHEILMADGTPVLPRDHWGRGCPFETDRTDTGEINMEGEIEVDQAALAV